MMHRLAKLLLPALAFSLAGIAPAQADDIVFNLGAGDGLSVEDTLPFEQLRVDDSGTAVKLKGGDTFRIQDSVASELLRLEDDGSLFKDGQLFLHTPGTDNTFVGQLAGNTGITNAEKNVALGTQSLSSNTAGDRNTAVGWWSLQTYTGSDNTAFGFLAINENATGTRNSAFGGNAMRKTLASDNSAFGYKALEGNQSGAQNTAFGSYALDSLTMGDGNTGIGYNALTAVSIGGGTGNIALGANAGSSLTGGSLNIYIGNTGVSSETGSIRIGSPSQSKTYIDGIYGSTASSGTAVYISSDNRLGTLTSSARFKESIRDMEGTGDVLMKLRPVTFRYREEHAGSDRPLQYGLVAEEVAQVDPGLVAYDENGDPYSVRYQFLAPMLLEEYQRQQRTVAEQSAQLAEQRQVIGEQRAVLDELRTRIDQLERRVR